MWHYATHLGSTINHNDLQIVTTHHIFSRHCRLRTSLGRITQYITSPKRSELLHPAVVAALWIYKAKLVNYKICVWMYILYTVRSLGKDRSITNICILQTGRCVKFYISSLKCFLIEHNSDIRFHVRWWEVGVVIGDVIWWMGKVGVISYVLGALIDQPYLALISYT